MGKMICHRSLLLRLNPRRNAIVALLGLCFNCVWLWPVPLHSLDPNKRISQYVHTSWRVRDGSVLHAGYAITQTTDGLLWFVSGDAMTTRSFGCACETMDEVSIQRFPPAMGGLVTTACLA